MNLAILLSSAIATQGNMSQTIWVGQRHGTAWRNLHFSVGRYLGAAYTEPFPAMKSEKKKTTNQRKSLASIPGSRKEWERSGR